MILEWRLDWRKKCYAWKLENNLSRHPVYQCTLASQGLLSWQRSCHGIVQGFQVLHAFGLRFQNGYLSSENTIIWCIYISYYHKEFMFFKIRKEILLLRQGLSFMAWTGLLMSGLLCCEDTNDADADWFMSGAHHGSCSCPSSWGGSSPLWNEIVKLRNITDSRKITCDVSHDWTFFRFKKFYQNNRATVRIHKPLPTHLDESAQTT